MRSARIGKRDVFHFWGIERDHNAALSFCQGADSRRAKAQAEQAVACGWSAAAQQVSQDDEARFFAGQRLQLLLNVRADATEPFGAPGFFANDAYAAAARLVRPPPRRRC